MAVKKSIEKEKLDDNRKAAKGLLSEKLLYKTLESSSSGGTRLSEKATKVAEAFEKFFGSLISVAEEAGSLYNLPEKSDLAYKRKKDAFENTYALYVGAAIGLETINSVYQAPPANTVYGKDLNFNSLDSMSGNLIMEYKNALNLKERERKDDKDEDLLAFTNSFFQTVINRCLKEKEKYPDLAGYLDEVELELEGLEFKGFSVKSSAKVAGRRHHEDVSWDTIVGNTEGKEALKSYIDWLFLYDPKTQKNVAKKVFELPKTVLMWGVPGTGKTLMLKAAENYMYEKAAKVGKEKNAKVVTIDHSNTKDMYHGESERKMRDAFEEGTDPDKISLIYIEDIDGLMGDRSDMKDGSMVNKSTFTQLLNILQGIGTENYGNYIIIATTNRPDLLDKALLQRLQEHAVELSGPKNEEEIKKLLEVHIRKGLDGGYISMTEEEWEEFGRMGMEMKFVGRDIEKLSKHIYGLAMSSDEIPDEFYKMASDDTEKALLSTMRKVDGKMILEETRKFHMMLADTKEKGDRLQMEDRVNALIFESKAEDEALKRLLKEKGGMEHVRETARKYYEAVTENMKVRFLEYGETIDDAELFKLFSDEKYYTGRLEEARKNHESKSREPAEDKKGTKKKRKEEPVGA